MKKQLAIVIPAYKGRFLPQTLESIARQTDKRFTVYVGDDASPDNLKDICDYFKDHLDIVYKRFNKNLGHVSLVDHWNRCIELSSETWIWLFCDDDTMSDNCVQEFYNTIDKENTRFDVIRFNTLTIDDNDHVVMVNPPHPLKEQGVQFIYHRLKGERLSYISEYIFSKEAFVKNSGLINFPLGWCSDDASWIMFSGSKGILTIQDGYVCWRRGNYNITPSGDKFQNEKIAAAFQFVLWLRRYFKENTSNTPHISYADIHELSSLWFIRQLNSVAPFKASNYIKFSKYLNLLLDHGFLFNIALLIRGDIIFFMKKAFSPLKR